jgi:sugar/nucleoside kinase (ribokinase family)
MGMLAHAPRLLVLGHVTRDLFGSEARLGGAAAFAARAAALLGIETALVTVAPEQAPELEELRGLPGLQLEVAGSECITTFEIEYSGSRRRLSLVTRARPLSWQDIPPAWRAAELVYVGPVAGECDEALLAGLADSYGIGCIQGWLRDPVPGPVRPRRLREAEHPPALLDVVSFSLSDHPLAPRIARELCEQGLIVAVTEGRLGARLSWGGQQCWVPAAPAREVDPTGAGDVFALVLGLSLWAGFEPPEAARRAGLAAARVVEGPGLGRLAEVREELATSAGQVG